MKENSLISRIFFSREPNKKVSRQEFKKYILYFNNVDKRSRAIVVDKQTGKTMQIVGVFGAKHLKWLRLKPL